MGRRYPDQAPADLTAIAGHEAVLQIDRDAITEQVLEKVQHWRALLTDHVYDGRELLKQLLAEPFTFTPNGKVYEFTADTRTGEVIAAAAGVPLGVRPQAEWTRWTAWEGCCGGLRRTLASHMLDEAIEQRARPPKAGSDDQQPHVPTAEYVRGRWPASVTVTRALTSKYSQPSPSGGFGQLHVDLPGR